MCIYNIYYGVEKARKKDLQNKMTFLCKVIRICLSGKEDGLDVGTMCEMLGKKETIKRLENCLNKISKENSTLYGGGSDYI